MTALFRLIFGAVTTASYHLRFLLIIAVAGALIASIMAHETPFKAGPVTLPWFTIVTVTLYLAISVPLKWRRLIIERSFFHRKALGAALTPVAIAFVLLTTVFESALLIFATLFSLPFKTGPEFNWTLSLLAATGAISFLSLKIFGEGCWKTARWSYFRLPLLIGGLFAALVHVVSTEEKTKQLFKAPSDEDAVNVLSNFFGERILQKAWSQLENRSVELDKATAKASAELSQGGVKICQALSAKNPSGDELRFPEAINFKPIENLEQLCTDTAALYKGILKPNTGKKNLFDNFSLNRERHRLSVFCDNVKNIDNVSNDYFEQVRAQNLDVWMNLRCGALLEKRTEAYCQALRDENEKQNFEENSDLRKELQSCSEPSAGQESEIPQQGDTIAGDADQLDDGNKNQEGQIGVLEAYSILDGYIHAKIVDAVGVVYVFWNDLEGYHQSFRTDAAMDYFCEQKSEENPNETIKKRFDDWCAPKSSLRAVASVVLSPYLLQGFVLSVYVTALLLAFRRRDQGDPDRPAQELLNAPDAQGRQTFATAGAGAIPDNPPRSVPLALRERRVATTKRALFDWLVPEQLPSVIDTLIDETEGSGPHAITQIPSMDDGANVEDLVDRPIHLGEFRIPAPDAKRFAQEQAKLHAALKNFANAVADIGAKSASAKDEWCKVFGPPLKYLLAKCPSEIRVHHELGSVLQDDLATEFKIYESLYFGSRDPAEIAKAFAKYERLRPVLRNSSDVVDVRSLKGLTDDQLCFLISLASAAAIGAVFK